MSSLNCHTISTALRSKRILEQKEKTGTSVECGSCYKIFKTLGLADKHIKLLGRQVQLQNSEDETLDEDPIDDAVELDVAPVIDMENLRRARFVIGLGVSFIINCRRTICYKYIAQCFLLFLFQMWLYNI